MSFSVLKEVTSVSFLSYLCIPERAGFSLLCGTAAAECMLLWISVEHWSCKIFIPDSVTYTVSYNVKFLDCIWIQDVNIGHKCLRCEAVGRLVRPKRRLTVWHICKQCVKHLEATYCILGMLIVSHYLLWVYLGINVLAFSFCYSL